MSQLEEVAKGQGYKYTLLETGKKQPEALQLYLKSGYTEMENYGPYIDNPNSICMKKQL